VRGEGTYSIASVGDFRRQVLYFYPHAIGQNSVTWLLLTGSEAGKCYLAVCAKEKETGSMNFCCILSI